MALNYPAAALLNVYVVELPLRPTVKTALTDKVGFAGEGVTSNDIVNNEIITVEEKKTPKKKRKGKRGKKNRNKKPEAAIDDEEDTDTEDDGHIQSNLSVLRSNPQVPVIKHRQYIELISQLDTSDESSPCLFRPKHERDLLQSRPRCPCGIQATNVVSLTADTSLQVPWILKSQLEAAGPNRRCAISSRINMSIVEGPLAEIDARDTNNLDEVLEVYGLYKPHMNHYASFCCDNIECTVYSSDNLHKLVKTIESKVFTDIDINRKPHHNAFDRPVCQVCGSEEVKYCGKGCSFAYCTREHQSSDRSIHKAYCQKRDEVRRKMNQSDQSDQSMLACHVFFGNPDAELKYHTLVLEVPSDWIQTHVTFNDDLTEMLTEATNFLFRTSTGKYVDCAICSKTAASSGVAFLSRPLVTGNADFEEEATKFEQQLKKYHDKGAFEDTSLSSILQNFKMHSDEIRQCHLEIIIGHLRKQVRTIAQCHVLIVPVCEGSCEQVVSDLAREFRDGKVNTA